MVWVSTSEKGMTSILNICAISLWMVAALSTITVVSGDFSTKERHDLLVLYARYCGPHALCDPDLVGFPLPANLSSTYQDACPPCFCDDKCHDFGDCCLDIALTDSRVGVPTQFQCINGFTVISECLKPGHTDSQCQKWDTGRLPVPVFSNETGNSYRSRACAACNGDDQSLTDWRVDISCREDTDFSFFSSLDELLKHTDCTVDGFKPRKHQLARPCNNARNLKISYNTCNQTGLWEKEDQNLAEACERFMFPIETGNAVVYKNVFCYHCNQQPSHNSLPPKSTTADLWYPMVTNPAVAMVTSPLTTGNDQKEPGNVSFLYKTPYHTKHSGMFPGTLLTKVTHTPSVLISADLKSSDSSIKEDPTTTSITTSLKAGTGLVADSMPNTWPNDQRVTSGVASHKSSLAESVSEGQRPSVQNVSEGRDQDTAVVTPETRINDAVTPLTTPKALDAESGKTDLYLDTVANSLEATPLTSPEAHEEESWTTDLYLDKMVVSHGTTTLTPTKALEIERTTEPYLDTVGIGLDVTTRTTPKAHSAESGSTDVYLDKAKDSQGTTIMAQARVPSGENGTTDLYLDTVGNNHDVTTMTTHKEPSGVSETTDLYLDKVAGSQGTTTLAPTKAPGGESWTTHLFHDTDTSSTVAVCNVTGRLETWDPRLDWACRYMLDFRGSIATYRNAFCCLCNQPEKRRSALCHYQSAESKKRFGQNSYHYLFAFTSFGTERKPESSNCDVGQYYDPLKDTCRDVSCSPGRILQTSDCVPFIQDGVRLRYSFRNTYIMTGHQNFSKEAWKEVLKDFRYKTIENITMEMENVTAVTSLHNATILYCATKNTKRILNAHIPHIVHECLNTVCKFIAFVTVKIDIHTSADVSRDLAEQTLLRLLDASVTQRFFNETLTSIPVTSNEQGVLELLEQEVKIEEKIAPLKCVQKVKVRLSTRTSQRFQKSRTRGFIPVHKLLMCPQIELNGSEFEHNVDNGVAMIQATGKRLTRDHYKTTSNQTLKVCIETYNVSAVPSQPNEDLLISRILRVVSTICTFVSLACLLITFTTYCIHEELRTIPGKNNMCLVALLFLAQASWFVGTEVTYREKTCAALGLWIHYLWLATFVSMNVCSFHMFRVFSGMKLKTLSSPAQQYKLLCYYLNYIFAAPIFVVTVTVVTNLLLSDGQSFGYGGKACFLSSPENTGYFFVLPVGLTMILNCVFFGITIVKIKTSPDLHQTSTAKNNRDIFVYMKLFTITGIAWALQIVDSQFTVVALSFASIVVNGCQGVFIFFAFICNDRVLRLYQVKLGLAPINRTSSSGGLSTGLYSTRKSRNSNR